MNSNKQDDFSLDLPLHVISQAVDGDEVAIEEVVKAYEPYIAAQCTVEHINDDGETVKTVNEDMAQSLRLALIEAIPHFKNDPCV